ncbi:integration host factor subunit alpha [Desulfogranum japonicum]|uniref:integration host factor subunit alpha n=1 Tax=Desulfogranum japonicum TaxID=231447 RepID=UPI002FC31612
MEIRQLSSENAIYEQALTKYNKVGPTAPVRTTEKKMKLTKSRIIKEIIKKHEDFSPKKASDSLETFLYLFKKCLIEGESVLISGFGKFIVNDKRQRRGRNPQTGEDLLLAPRRVVTFHTSGKLKDKINAGSPEPV